MLLQKYVEVNKLKIERKTLVTVLCIMIGAICISFGASKLFKFKSNKVEEYVYISRVNSSNKQSEEENVNENKVDESNEANTNEEVNDSTDTTNNIIYDGMTLEEISDQLNRSLNSTLAGKGDYIASYSIERGVDPYLATAIMLHETGCTWNCSTLVVSCNNVGGMKGNPSCGNGSYRKFNTLDEGIKAFIDNLANNYYAYGLTTPELMNSRYAESTAWAGKVNTYINKIKSN